MFYREFLRVCLSVFVSMLAHELFLRDPRDGGGDNER